MGADIHLFVEYDNGGTGKGGLSDKSPREPFTVAKNLFLFAEGDIRIPRHYGLFACFAGVRNHNEVRPLFEPRGFPDVHSNELLMQFTDYVYDEDLDSLRFENDVERSLAQEYVSSGKSRFFDDRRKINARVSNPEWHTPSWLYRDEMIMAMDHCGLSKEPDIPVEFRVTLDLLASLERHFGSKHARAVFWFDN